MIYNAAPNLTFDFSADVLRESDTESFLTTDYSTVRLLATILPFAPFNAIPTFDPTSRDESLNSPEYGHRIAHGASGRFDYDFPGVRLTSITAVRGYTSNFAADIDGTSLNAASETSADSANQISQEIRLTSTGESRFRWIAGFFFYHENLHDVFTASFLDQFPTPLLGLPFLLPAGYVDTSQTNTRVVENSYAGFLSATYDFTPRLSLAGGFRFTVDRKTLNFLQEDLNPEAFSLADLLLATIPPRVEQLSESEPTGDVSLSYKFTPSQVGYIKFSRGYKAGGFNAITITQPFPAGTSLSFRPEFLNNYEAGYKGSLFNGHLTVNTAVFYDDYTDKQESVENAMAISIIVENAAKARIYGAEFEVDVVPTPGLTLSGTLGLLNGRYQTFLDPGGNARGNFNGNTLANAPGEQATLAVQYVHPMGSSGLTGFARLETTFQSATYADPVNTPGFVAHAYALLNGRIGVNNGRWGAYLWGRNLTNDFHLSGGLFELLTTVRAVNLPRTFGLELNYKY